MYTFLIIVFHVYLGLLWRVHTREHGSGMLSLVLEFIKVSLFPGGCIPERESNWMCFVSRFTTRFTSDRLRREKDARPPPPCCLGEYACKTRLDFYNPILVDISSSSCFQGGVFPKEETKWEIIEYEVSNHATIPPRPYMYISGDWLSTHGALSCSSRRLSRLSQRFPK